ncbi:MAG TPA: hypothetical protein VHT21_08325 [Stellaceae bacterium]|jgi:hypothetical protein|nr:hypothetical protein [Stellaceae bacterium]
MRDPLRLPPERYTNLPFPTTAGNCGNCWVAVYPDLYMARFTLPIPSWFGSVRRPRARPPLGLHHGHDDMIRMHATCRYDDRSVAPSGNSQAIDDTLLGAGHWGSARAVVCGGLLGDAEQF